MELVHDVCVLKAENQLAAFKMGLTSTVVSLVDENNVVLKTIAAMCSECEPARELVVFKLKSLDQLKIITS